MASHPGCPGLLLCHPDAHLLRLRKPAGIREPDPRVGEWPLPGVRLAAAGCPVPSWCLAVALLKGIWTRVPGRIWPCSGFAPSVRVSGSIPAIQADEV